MDFIQPRLSDIQHNLTDTVTRLTIKDYLRLLIIVCGYALLRSYLVKLGGWFQARDHDRAIATEEASSEAAVSPNSLQAQVVIPDNTDDEDEHEHDDRDDAVKKLDWGRQARQRQRRMLRKLLEAEEKARQEAADADSDREIEEFLIKDP
ncbi:MAG: hypothetical protein M1815_002063 [Lichina confinis]|nr:MAG: hypothetical protein M1815_002063 [Lichina confinis]